MSDPHAHDSASQGSMVVPMTYKPIQVADVLELDMGDGFILYNHDSDLVHHLNPSAAIVWQLCDGRATVEELGRDVGEEYALDVATVQREIATVIAEFDALGLVRDADSDPPSDLAG